MALTYFAKIYKIEAACKSEGLHHEQRLARRQEQSALVVAELYAWIHELHATDVPGTLLHDATRYAVNQEARWRRCFTDGDYEIDNGEHERQLRRVALGRKTFYSQALTRAPKEFPSRTGTGHLSQAWPRPARLLGRRDHKATGRLARCSP